MTEQQADDFITRYVRLLGGITDAPGEFQEAAVLFLISTAVGRKWLFRSVPETSIFANQLKSNGKLLNLWFILIGKSRVTRRTTGVINHVVGMLEEIFGRKKMLTEAFTPEALIEQMSKMSDNSLSRELETVCCWVSDEIAWFFQLLKKRDSYMISADAFLSKIYDGSTYSRGTVGRGKEVIWNPYFTCLLASTDYLPTLFDELQIRLGFMNRFIFVKGKRAVRKPLRTESLTDDEKKQANDIRDFLKAVLQITQAIVLEMSIEAKQTYDHFEEGIEKQIENEDLGVKEGYCGQLPNLAVRLSCLYRISRMTAEEIRSHNKPVLTVEEEDVERAISYALKAWSWFEDIIDIMQSSAKEGIRDSLTGIGREKILELLKEGPKKREYFIESLKKLDIRHSLLDNVILRNLLKDNLIQRDSSGWYSLVEKRSSSSLGNGGETHDR